MEYLFEIKVFSEIIDQNILKYIYNTINSFYPSWNFILKDNFIFLNQDKEKKNSGNKIIFSRLRNNDLFRIIIFDKEIDREKYCNNSIKTIFINLNYLEKDFKNAILDAEEYFKNTKIQKKIIRKIIKSKKLKLLNNVYIAKKSQIINNKIIQTEQFINAKIIFIYWPMNDEVDIKDIIKNEKKRFILPVIKENDLILKEFKGALYQEDKYGIMEPSGKEFREFSKVDLAIIPGVGFDRENNRIGRGKGYYDKILKRFQNIYKIGVCFDFQIFEKIEVEKHDIKMDLLISENYR